MGFMGYFRDSSTDLFSFRSTSTHVLVSGNNTSSNEEDNEEKRMTRSIIVLPPLSSPPRENTTRAKYFPPNHVGLVLSPHRPSTTVPSRLSNGSGNIYRYQIDKHTVPLTPSSLKHKTSIFNVHPP
jgi:hypothetical protein